jgi:Domain of unknown function (DUF1835)
MTREAGFKRRVRARMERTGETYSAARRQLDAGPPVLHVTNGDSVAGTLREAGVPGRVLAWRDVLHDGPVPAVGDAELRRVRAAHLAGRGWGEAAAIERDMAARDALLAEGARGECVLWFEADLYDQLQLAQVLDALRRLGADPARLSLVSVGEYRGIAHFGGLGELRAEQLAALAEQAQPLAAEALDLGAAAWAAFTAPDPSGLAAITRVRSAELRFLGEAFGRLLQEYPSRGDGLSLTERRVLMAAAAGAGTAGEVFARVSRAERRPFLVDAVCWAVMAELAGGAAPLLAVEGASEPFARRRVAATAAGADVLAGREDHVRLNGVDRWVGGVRLSGRAVPWRYDERLESLVAG